MHFAILAFFRTRVPFYLRNAHICVFGLSLMTLIIKRPVFVLREIQKEKIP